MARELSKRQRVYERDGHRCVLCGSTDDLTLDHIVPRARGGTNDESNLRTLCGDCNQVRAEFRTDEETKALTAWVPCSRCSTQVRRHRLWKHLRQEHGEYPKTLVWRAS